MSIDSSKPGKNSLFALEVFSIDSCTPEHTVWKTLLGHLEFYIYGWTIAEILWFEISKMAAGNQLDLDVNEVLFVIFTTYTSVLCTAQCTSYPVEQSSKVDQFNCENMTFWMSAAILDFWPPPWIYFVFSSRVGFLGSAGRMALLPVRSHPRWLPKFIKQRISVLNWSIFKRFSNGYNVQCPRQMTKSQTVIQESSAIAKMTALCALFMGAQQYRRLRHWSTVHRSLSLKPVKASSANWQRALYVPIDSNKFEKKR